MNKEPLMSAETLLKETIENYNEKVSHVYQFAFNKSEKDLFVNMMKTYTEWHLDRVAEVVCEEADTTQKECFYSGVRAGGSYFISIVDKQSITNAIKEYINENFK